MKLLTYLRQLLIGRILFPYISCHGDFSCNNTLIATEILLRRTGRDRVYILPVVDHRSFAITISTFFALLHQCIAHPDKVLPFDLSNLSKKEAYVIGRYGHPADGEYTKWEIDSLTLCVKLRCETYLVTINGVAASGLNYFHEKPVGTTLPEPLTFTITFTVSIKDLSVVL